jgi:hypothetical protein
LTLRTWVDTDMDVVNVVISYDSKYAVAIVNDQDEHFEVKGYDLATFECSWVSKFKGVYIKMALID